MLHNENKADVKEKKGSNVLWRWHIKRREGIRKNIWKQYIGE